MGDRRVELVVPELARGTRLDRFLADALDVPRSQIKRWIVDGAVRVDRRPSKASSSLAGGERVTVERPEPSPDDRVDPEPGELVILYEDSEIVALDKPAGLAMHPGAGRATGTLVHRLVAAYPEMASVGGPGRPGVVHRLDIDTTGVVVVARTASAYRRLSQDFSERRVQKVYLALGYGVPQPAEGSWTDPIGRHPARRKEMTVRSDGRAARTDYAVIATAAGVSLFRLDLGTGRTHQIRVHLKAAGHPLVGDPIYGEARWKGLEPRYRRVVQAFPRPALHAWVLGLRHPVSGDALKFTAPAPDDLVKLWAELSGQSELPLGA